MNARWKFACLTAAAAVGVAVTFSLGVWQLSRAERKQALAASIHTQETLPATNAAELLGEADIHTLLHRRAQLRGHWVADATVYLENRPQNGRAGFVVLTPLRLQGSTQALVVQRGWVPRDFVSRNHVPAVPTPTHEVEVQGRIALPPSQLYEPGPSSAGHIRQNIDLARYQKETGLPLLPLTLQQTGPQSDGLARDWPAANTGVAKHHGYAAQWFALAALITGLYAWFQVYRRFFPLTQDTSHHV